jgi:hypothetical protein
MSINKRDDSRFGRMTLYGKAEEDRPLLTTFIVRAVQAYSQGNGADLDLVVTVLLESEAAKHNLRLRGYGVTGMGILETVWEVRDA